jgi:hypothetical protein
VEAVLRRVLPSESQEPARLHAAMRYAALGDGKVTDGFTKIRQRAPFTFTLADHLEGVIQSPAALVFAVLALEPRIQLIAAFEIVVEVVTAQPAHLEEMAVIDSGGKNNFIYSFLIIYIHFGYNNWNTAKTSYQFKIP